MFTRIRGTEKRRRRAWPTFVLALVAACARGSERPRNVVVIAIDGLRCDEVGAWGGPTTSTPALDALAESGLRFDAAYASAPCNVPSLASMWTGRLPWEHGVQNDHDVLDADARTLAEVLAERGFDTFGVASDFRAGRARGLDQGFATFSTVDVEALGEPTSDRVAQRVIQLLDLYEPSTRPFFLFAHLSDPKPPLVRHSEDEGRIELAGALRGGESLDYLQVARETLDAAELRAIRALYSAEVREADRAVARIVADLERRQVLDETLLIVVGSAGFEWNDRGWIGDGHSLHDELVHVPLILRSRACASGAIERRPVSLCGLARTVLDLVAPESAPPAGACGGWLDGEQRLPARPEAVFFGVQDDPHLLGARTRAVDLRGVRDGPWKLILDSERGAGRVYDLAHDPRELVDLADRDREHLRVLAERLAARSSSQP